MTKSYQNVQDMPVAGMSGWHPTMPLKEQIETYSNDMPHNGREADSYGSRLNHKTGQLDPRSSKAETITRMNVQPSAAFKAGYDCIKWNSNKEPVNET